MQLSGEEMYFNSGENNKDLECAIDPMHPKQDWVIHQYKIRGFEICPMPSKVTMQNQGQSIKPPYSKLH